MVFETDSDFWYHPVHFGTVVPIDPVCCRDGYLSQTQSRGYLKDDFLPYFLYILFGDLNKYTIWISLVIIKPNRPKSMPWLNTSRLILKLSLEILLYKEKKTQQRQQMDNAYSYNTIALFVMYVDEGLFAIV